MVPEETLSGILAALDKHEAAERARWAQAEGKAQARREMMEKSRRQEDRANEELARRYREENPETQPLV